MKNVLVAVDSFKGSMSSREAGMAIENGIKSVMQECQVKVRPVADGGEGTTEALIYGKNGIRREKCEVAGPTGGLITAEYITYNSPEDGGRTAVMEMAAAAGLTLVPENKRNPMHTTTYGVGEMIRDAVGKGCTRFIIGIGGSATNDGGIGMLQALGFSFLDENGKDVPYGAEGLGKLMRIEFPCGKKESSPSGITGEKNENGDTDCAIYAGDESDFAKKILGCHFRVACDVTNPLVGELGCSRVFAPQKGADAEMVQTMELYMERYADIAERAQASAVAAGTLRRLPDESKCDRYTPGAGAAGGLGYAFMMFLNAKLMPGIDIVLAETHLEDAVRWADTVITGEGRIDAQTMMGKTPAGVAGLAKKHGRHVIAIGGCLGEGAENCVKSGLFDECYAVNDVLGIDTSNLEEIRKSMERDTATANLEKCTARIVQLKNKLSDRICRPAKLL